MHDQPILRLFKRRGWWSTAEEYLDTAAFVDPVHPETIVFVDVPSPDDDPLQFFRTLNHEMLHVVIRRLGLGHAVSYALDRFVDKRRTYCERNRAKDEILLLLVGL